MEQTAVEFYHSELKKILYNVIVTPEQVMEMADALAQAKEMENQQKDDYAIELLEWLTNKKSKFAILYGNQKERFATIEENYTSKQLLEKFKNK